MNGKRVVAVVAGVAVVILVVFAARSRRSAGKDACVRNEALRREMLERAAVVRGLGGGPGVEEARAVLRWWFDATAAAGAADARKGENAKEEAWRRYAEERLIALQAGYNPALSASDQGLRLDILSVRP